MLHKTQDLSGVVLNVEMWSNDSTQGSTMDIASPSDKPDTSAATNDNHPGGRFSYSVSYSPLQKNYRANVDKHALA